MNFKNIINEINSKEDFLEFISQLSVDKEQRSEEWENKDIQSYLEGISSWIEDMEGYYENMNMDIPKNIDWKFIATLFYVGKIYE